MENFCLTKDKVLRINSDTYLLIFEERLPFEPGQFVMIETPQLVRKPFMLGRWNEALAISVQMKGVGTRYIVQEARKLKAHGPLGKAFVPPEGRGVVVASPTCVTMANYLQKRCNCEVVIGSKTQVRLELPFKTVVGDHEFLRLLPTLQYDWCLVAGSDSMKRVVWETFKNKKEHLFFTLEEYMGCGVGACKSCSFLASSGLKYVCKDGPIFRGDELCWE